MGVINRENFTQEKYDAFALFDEKWALLTAGTPEDYNTMTIGWGTLGSIWGPANGAKKILTAFVRESRYTHELLQRSDFFTVTFFPKEYEKDLGILGSRSGRGGDKIALTRLTPKPVDGAVGFEEASLTFVCRKIYAQRFDENAVPEDVKREMYPAGDIHWMYIGEIEDAFGEV